MPYHPPSLDLPTFKRLSKRLHQTLQQTLTRQVAPSLTACQDILAHTFSFKDFHAVQAQLSLPRETVSVGGCVSVDALLMTEYGPMSPRTIVALEEKGIHITLSMPSDGTPIEAGLKAVMRLDPDMVVVNESVNALIPPHRPIPSGQQIFTSSSHHSVLEMVRSGQLIRGRIQAADPNSWTGLVGMLSRPELLLLTQVLLGDSQSWVGVRHSNGQPDFSGMLNQLRWWQQTAAHGIHAQALADRLEKGLAPQSHEGSHLFIEALARRCHAERLDGFTLALAHRTLADQQSSSPESHLKVRTSDEALGLLLGEGLESVLDLLCVRLRADRLESQGDAFDWDNQLASLRDLAMKTGNLDAAAVSQLLCWAVQVDPNKHEPVSHLLDVLADLILFVNKQAALTFLALRADGRLMDALVSAKDRVAQALASSSRGRVSRGGNSSGMLSQPAPSVR